MTPAQDARLQSALAAVERDEAALGQACARALATAHRPRCAFCGQHFTPKSYRQKVCHARECDRQRHDIERCHWEQNRAAAALERRGLGHDLLCACGGRLWPFARQDGTAADRCGRCGRVQDVRRAAA